MKSREKGQISCSTARGNGIIIAQKLETAVQPDMPESAIDTGCVDYILSPEDIARAIVRISDAPVQRSRMAQ